MSTSARMSMVVFVVLLCMVLRGSGQPAPSPELDCTNTVTLLFPCLDYVTNSSLKVSEECCSGLASARAGSPLCLCAFLDPSGSSAELGINVTRALELPAVCNVEANPANCAAAGSPPVAASPPVAGPVPSTSPAPAVSPVTRPSAAPPTAVAPPPPSDECNSKIAELAPCLTFVTGQADPPPSKACCTSLAGVVATAATCLCTLVDSGDGTSSSVPGLNSTLALQLPTYCQVQVNLAECTGGSTNTPDAGVPAPLPPLPGGYTTMTVSSPFLTIILVAATAFLLQ